MMTKIGERGGSVIELAILLPLLLLLLLGVADFGRVFYFSITLSNASRAGAQYGIQSIAKAGDAAGIRQAVLVEAMNIEKFEPIEVSSAQICECLDETGVSCAIEACTDGYGAPRVFVEVTASTTFRTIVPYPGIPSTVPFSRTVKMRLQ